MARELPLSGYKIQKGGRKKMKKKLVIGLVVALTLTVGGGLAMAQWGYGGWGHMTGPWYGHMTGPGYGGYMMGPGYANYANNCWGNGPEAYGETKALTTKDTESILRNYIGANPNLKVGKIQDKGKYFEGEIVTKDNSLVAKLGVDKNTGWVQPVE
jgi:hypothetical protein